MYYPGYQSNNKQPAGPLILGLVRPSLKNCRLGVTSPSSHAMRDLVLASLTLCAPPTFKVAPKPMPLHFSFYHILPNSSILKNLDNYIVEIKWTILKWNNKSSVFSFLLPFHAHWWVTKIAQGLCSGCLQSDLIHAFLDLWFWNIHKSIPRNLRNPMIQDSMLYVV